MPNPASSGTGFFDVTAWLALWGEKGGWDYMDKLHANIAQYTHSGSKPCNQAAAGEFVVGISFEYRANTNKAKGAPIDLVFPKEGLGWDLEAFGIHKGTKKLEAAKKLADWASSKNAMILYGKNFAITAQPGVAEPLPNIPKDYEERLVKMDFKKAAEGRERILAGVDQALQRQVRAEKVTPVTPAGATFLRLEGIRKDFGAFTALRDIRLEVPRGEFVCFPRPVGLRQDHAAAHHRGPGGADRRHHPPGRPRHLRAAARAARLRHRVPVVCAVSESLDLRQRRLRPGQPARRPRGGRVARGGAAEPRRPARQRREIPGAALRRPAAEDRARPRAGNVARAAAARRAAVRAGCDRARAPAPGNPRSPGPPGRHHHHGDARPGRGAVDGGPHRGDEPRGDRPDRHADAGLPRAGHALSSRISSAR